MNPSVLELAVRHGLLTPAQVEAWHRTGQPLEGTALVADLEARGFLDPDEAGLLRSLLQTAAAPPDTTENEKVLGS